MKYIHLNSKKGVTMTTAYQTIKEYSNKNNIPFGVLKSEVIDTLGSNNGMSITFSGKYTDKLTEILGHTPTEEDIVSIIDCNGHNYGYKCSIDGNSISGEIYID